MREIFCWESKIRVLDWQCSGEDVNGWKGRRWEEKISLSVWEYYAILSFTKKVERGIQPHHKNLYEDLMGGWRGINDGDQGGGYEILLLCRKETKANACRL